MSHYGDALSVNAIFLGEKVAAERGMNTKHLKVFSRGGHTADMFRLISRSEIETNVGVTGNVLEQLSVLPQMFQLIRGEVHLIGLRLVRFGKLNDAGRLRKGKWAEQHAVYNCKNGSVGPHAKSKRQYADGGEPGALCQHPRGVPQILPDCLHPVPPRFRGSYAPTRASCVSSTILPSNR